MAGYCAVSGKARHATRKDGIQALRRLGYRGSVYCCGSCGGYHHTSYIDNLSPDQRKALARKKKRQADQG